MLRNPYRTPKPFKARMEVNESTEGLPIEKHIEMMLNNGQNPEELMEKEMIYKRPEEQLGEHDIRHDFRDEQIQNIHQAAEKNEHLDKAILKARKEILKKNEEILNKENEKKGSDGDQAKTTD